MGSKSENSINMNLNSNSSFPSPNSSSMVIDSNLKSDSKSYSTCKFDFEDIEEDDLYFDNEFLMS